MIRSLLGVLAIAPHLAAAAEPPSAAFQPSTPPGVNFAPRVDYRTAAGPVTLAVADVHRMGKLDIIVGSATSGKINVLLGRGDGTFLTRTEYPAFVPSEFGIYGLAVSDANLDGKPDILFQSVRQTGLLKNRGDGTFLPPVFFDLDAIQQTGYGLEGFTTADLNRDGKIDMITWAGELGVLVQSGDGRGGFAKEYDIAASDNGGFPNSVTVADLNRDGKPDLLVGSIGPDSFPIHARLANGDGTFRDGGKLAAGGLPITADLNFDDRTDVVQADSATNSVVVSLGRGDGTFLPSKSFPTGGGPGAIAVADVNRDGKPDIVVADYTGNTVSVLLGQGNGVFVSRRVFPVGHQPSAVAVADVNADGFADIVVSSRTDNLVSVLLGKAP